MALTLKALVLTSEQMLQAAREDDWAFVIESEAERRPKLETFFGDWNLHQESLGVDVVRISTEKILCIDKEITQLAEKSKQELWGSLNQLGSSKKAALAYIENSV